MVKLPKIVVKETLRSAKFNLTDKAIVSVFAISNIKDRIEAKGSIEKFDIDSLSEEIVFVLNDSSKTESLKNHISDAISTHAVTTFGIEPRVVVEGKNEFIARRTNELKNVNFWLYSNGVVHKYKKAITFADWISESSLPEWSKLSHKFIPPIISNICVLQEVPRSWQSKCQQHTNVVRWFNDNLGIYNDRKD